MLFFFYSTHHRLQRTMHHGKKAGKMFLTLIRNIFGAANKHIRMFSEGPRGTEY